MRKLISVVAYVLVVIGALNWGLWGFFQFDLVAWLFKGNTNMMSRFIYSLIGLGGVWSLGSFCRCCKTLCGRCCCCDGKGDDNCKKDHSCK